MKLHYLVILAIFSVTSIIYAHDAIESMKQHAFVEHHINVLHTTDPTTISGFRG